MSDPKPAPEPRWLLDGKPVSQAEYEKAFQALVTANRNPPPAPEPTKPAKA